MLMGVTYVVQSATAVAGQMNYFRYLIVPIQDAVYLLIYLFILSSIRAHLRLLKSWRAAE